MAHGKTECIERRKQLQIVLDALEKSRRFIDSFDTDLNAETDSTTVQLLQQRQQTLKQEKEILSARISRLNKQLSLIPTSTSSPAASSRWLLFSSQEQLRTVCELLLDKASTQAEEASQQTKDLHQLMKDNADLVSQVKAAEARSAFLLEKMGQTGDSEVAKFLQRQLEITRDEKMMLQLQLDEEKALKDYTVAQSGNTLPELKSKLPITRRSLPVRLQKSIYVSSEENVEATPHTPPRIPKPQLSISNYAKLERSINVTGYKQKTKESSISMDDLQLPALPKLMQTSASDKSLKRKVVRSNCVLVLETPNES